MSGKNSNWLSDIKQCIHYKEPDLDCTLGKKKVPTGHDQYLLRICMHREWMAQWPKDLNVLIQRC